uniref:PAC domain-containing protein n=1 Tax=Heterorhabditis bacteriophora TaxID=37862 RepID=A0A1I7XM98_HETBA
MLVSSPLVPGKNITNFNNTDYNYLSKLETPIWLLVHLAPIKNDKDCVVLYLCQFKDITPLKQPLDDENNKGLSRILQIARIAKSKQQFNQIETKDLHKTSAPASSNFNQVMNLGGDMLPQYRQETPKTSPHIILHYSTFKTIWDWSILALTFYTAFMVPFNIAFKNRDYPGGGIDSVALMDSIVDVIFFADILLNFHTTFVGPGGEVSMSPMISDTRHVNVVIEPSVIRHNYFKSWFLIDLLSCLPYDIFYMFKKDDERIGSLFSALKVVRLLRLGRVARKLDNYSEYGAATLLLLLCAYVLVAHWLACIWFSIGEYEVRLKMDNPLLPDGWLFRLANDLKSPYNINLSNRTRLIGGPSRTSSYISCLILSFLSHIAFFTCFALYFSFFIACLGKGDVFGDEFWKNNETTGQSAANVRALTYTDLHMIKRDKLMEVRIYYFLYTTLFSELSLIFTISPYNLISFQVLNFYKAFANSFARNLVLTYNLTHRLKFRKVVDVKREKELDARRKNEKLTLPPDHPVRKLLFRMRERHGPRIFPSPMFADIEKVWINIVMC